MKPDSQYSGESRHSPPGEHRFASFLVEGKDIEDHHDHEETDEGASCCESSKPKSLPNSQVSEADDRFYPRADGAKESKSGRRGNNEPEYGVHPFLLIHLPKGKILFGR